MKKQTRLSLIGILVMGLSLSFGPHAAAQEIAEYSHPDSEFCQLLETNDISKAKSNSYRELSKKGGALQEGNYYLASDLMTNSTIRINKGTVTICLNGHKIDKSKNKNGAVIIVEKGATLNLCDNGQNKGQITGGVSGIIVNGTLNMYDGTISGNKENTVNGGGVRVENGTFNMYGGTITNNNAVYGGGVYVGAGTFAMYDGTITNNTAQYSGGVHVSDLSGSKATIYGGTITMNTATTNSGGVGVDNALTISGNVEITSNTVKGNADNLHIYEGKKVVIGKKGLSNKKPIGVTTNQSPTNNKPVSITGVNTEDYSTYFTADKKDYSVVNTGSRQEQVVNLAADSVEVAGSPEIVISQETEVTFESGKGQSASVNAQQVTISNSGNKKVDALTVKLTGPNADAFVLSTTTIEAIEAGKSFDFTVKPKDGLTAGTYTATVSVSGKEVETRSFDVSYTVEEPEVTFDFDSIRVLRAAEYEIDHQNQEIRIKSESNVANVALYYAQTPFGGKLALSNAKAANVVKNSGSVYIVKDDTLSAEVLVEITVDGVTKPYTVTVDFDETFDFTAIRTLRTDSVEVNHTKRTINIESSADAKNIVVYFHQNSYVQNGILSITDEGSADITYNPGSVYINRGNGTTTKFTATMNDGEREEIYHITVNFKTSEENMIQGGDLRMYQRRNGSTQSDIFTGNQVGYVDNTNNTIFIFPDSDVSTIGITKRQGVSEDNKTCTGFITAELNSLPSSVWVDSQSCIFVSKPESGDLVEFIAYYERGSVISEYKVVVDFSASSFNPTKLKMLRGSVDTVDTVNNIIYINPEGDAANVGIYYKQAGTALATVTTTSSEVTVDNNGFIRALRPSTGNSVQFELTITIEERVRNYTVVVNF